MYKFDDREFRKLAEKLASLSDKVKGRLLYRGAQKGAQEVVGALKKPGGPLNAPPGHSSDSLHMRTGHLSGRVFSVIKAQSESLIVGFGSDVEYAKYHDPRDARRVTVIRPKNKKVLRFTVGKKVVFTRKPITILTRRPFGKTVDNKKVQQDFVRTMARSMVEGIEVELNK